MEKEQLMRRENKSNYQLGIGLSSYVEFCGTGPSKEHKAIGLMTSGFESAVVRIHPLGTVTVISGSCPAGQGHETAWSLIVSQELGINFEDIEVITGETSNVPWGEGLMVVGVLLLVEVLYTRRVSKLLINQRYTYLRFGTKIFVPFNLKKDYSSLMKNRL